MLDGQQGDSLYDHSLPSFKSSTSLASSFSLSAVSMLPAAAPSSQSDTNALDHSLSSSPSNSGFTSAGVRPTARSSSLANMGQNYSQGQPSVSMAPSSASKAFSLRNAPSAGGFKLKRVFGRKNSEGTSSPSDAYRSRGNDSGRSREHHGFSEVHAQAGPVLPQPPTGAKQRTLSIASHVFTGKKPALSPTSPRFPGPPPLPPPKPPGFHMAINHSPSNGPQSLESPEDQQYSLPASPNLSPALHYIRSIDARGQQDLMKSVPVEQREDARREMECGDQKDDWRKSDSTVGHHNYRPNAGVGTRTPRPVSMAESVQSNHTVVPGNNRLSALVNDSEFLVAEEDDSDDSDDSNSVSIPSMSSGNRSPASSLRSRTRRSLSLNIAPPTPPKVMMPGYSDLPVSSSESELKFLSPNPSHRVPSGSVPISSMTKETPTLSRAAANGLITPSNSSTTGQSTGSHIRGRLAAWSATNANGDAALSSSRPLPAIPPSNNGRPPIAPGSPGPRKTTISITSSFAPAAGLAKRAVEKMGRAWGGLSSNSSSSGYSSSSSSRTTPSTTFSSISDDSMSTSDSHYASTTKPTNPMKMPKGKARRTPNAASAAWSVVSSNTSSSAGDSETFSTSTGPNLGKCMREPIRLRSDGTTVASGILFKTDLMTAVRMTSVDSSPIQTVSLMEGTHLRALEARKLPALVVRCAQHLLIWGVQEEGLFRVSGRPSHVAKLRAGFDTGADYDMMECSPGDIDPHAVASIFKAYLRELPEPILTLALGTYFEEAISAEVHQTSRITPTQGLQRLNTPQLPSSPRDKLQTLRKPPSLSTLAMPSFTGMQPPSESLLDTLRALLTQLPQENRDLIRTVVELIQATAKHSRVTKMPLSNLLVVFCPSLNMNPPLLRILCESDGIWSPTTDKRVVGTDQKIPNVAPQDHPSADKQISEERVMDGQGVASTSGQLEPTASEVTQPTRDALTIYLDSQDFITPSSVRDDSANTPSTASPETRSLNDDAAFVPIPEGYSTLSPTSATTDIALDAPTPPSSSGESLVTPPTSSRNPSYPELTGSDGSKPSSARHSLVIADTSPFSLPRKTNTGGTVQFPRCESLPTTPLGRRKSIPFLRPSDPNVDSENGSSSNFLPLQKRTKKPSLHLLFSKLSGSSPQPSPSIPLRSASSFPSSYLKSNNSSNSSSPMSTVTAPPSLPPSLDTSIETCVLELGLGDDDVETERDEKRQTITSMKPALDPLNCQISTTPSSSSSAIGVTPIADRFLTPSTSFYTLSSDKEPSHLGPSNESVTSFASAYSLNLSIASDDGPEEDWARSVLMAADADGEALV